MSCSDYNDAIAESSTARSTRARQRALERHVEAARGCRALVADLRSIQAAAFTSIGTSRPPHVLRDARVPDRSEPPPAPPPLWRGRASRAAVGGLGRPPPRSSCRRGRHLSARPQPARMHDRSRAAAPSTRTIRGDRCSTSCGAAEAHYDKAIQELEQIAKSDSGALDPQVAGVLQKNLQVIDQAIGESRAALKTQPASADAQDSLFDAMRSKVALLQQTVELINEMRKGNQAEAGRLIQGLNQ